MESAFEIMIGKFSALPFVQSNSILGPIIVSAYNSVILFFALNIFISIIIDSFEKVRAEANRNSLTPKQMKLASVAGDKNKIEGADFKALRKGKKKPSGK
jgi:hypothetical protein